MIGFLIFTAFYGAFFSALVWVIWQAVRDDFEPVTYDTTPEKFCVMCDCSIKRGDESKKWKGAHTWCEGYY